ncbi:MAG: SHOCT domain-containing protein [Clostridiales bacterium]|nr:SHOCT domain-containing protein [Clostridiales bacterium]
MKKFRLVSNIMTIVAISLFMLSIVLSAISASLMDAALLALIEVNLVLIACAGIGVFLMFAKNETARKLGNGMTVVGFLTGLVCALGIVAATGEEDDISIGAIVLIVSFVVFVLHYAFLLVDYLLNRNSANLDPNDDIRIVRVREWKALLEEGIISEEEYEEKRIQLLGIKSKDNKK